MAAAGDQRAELVGVRANRVVVEVLAQRIVGGAAFSDGEDLRQVDEQRRRDPVAESLESVDVPRIVAQGLRRVRATCSTVAPKAPTSMSSTTPASAPPPSDGIPKLKPYVGALRRS